MANVTYIDAMGREIDPDGNVVKEEAKYASKPSYAVAPEEDAVTSEASSEEGTSEEEDESPLMAFKMDELRAAAEAHDVETSGSKKADLAADLEEADVTADDVAAANEDTDEE